METTTTTEEQHPVKIERFARNLRVKLSDKEIVERAQRTAFLLGEVDQKTDEMKTARDHAKAAIAELDTEARRLSLEVRDGAAHREVMCERRLVYRLGVVQEVRLDTGEIMNERPMTDRERQPELPNLEAKANGSNGASAEASDGDGDGDADAGIVDDDYGKGEPEPPLETKKAKGRKRKGS